MSTFLEGMSVAYKAFKLLLDVRLERAWVAASLSTELSLVSDCTTAGTPPTPHKNPVDSGDIVASVLMQRLMPSCLCTQISEDVFAGLVEAHGSHSLAGSCFHAVIRCRQKVDQDLLNILLVEKFAILS